MKNLKVFVNWERIRRLQKYLPFQVNEVPTSKLVSYNMNEYWNETQCPHCENMNFVTPGSKLPKRMQCIHCQKTFEVVE